MARTRASELTPTGAEGPPPTPPPHTENPIETYYQEATQAIAENFWLNYLPQNFGTAIQRWIKDPANQNKLVGRLSLEGIDFFGSESGGTEALPEAPTVEATCEPSA
jgi:hypothetical protein